MSTPENIKTFGPVLGLVGAIIIYFLGRYHSYWDKRKANRSYILVESMNTSYQLKNIKTKPGAKIIITDDYQKIIEKIKSLKLDRNEGFLNNAYMGYLRFKNVGPGLIIGAEVKMHMSSKNQAWKAEAYFPILEEGEEIYVSTDKKEAFNEPYYVDEVVVIYKTQFNEEIKYVYKERQAEENPEINNTTETYFVKHFKWYNKIHKVDTPPTQWMYLD